jgi:glutamate N-acetyltransferase / amino-acid N-acetyltransferase
MPPLKRFAKPLSVSSLPRGFLGAGVTCGFKPSGKPDLALFVSDRIATAAAVTTQNLFAAPPIHVTRDHLKSARARAMIINSGCANAATGRQGLADARQMCALVSAALDIRSVDVLVNSTGVIGERLPLDRLAAGVDDAVSNLCAAGLNRAVEAMMTTDKHPKRTARRWTQGRREIRLATFAKGVGMVHPDMATMISVALTDAAVSAPLLRRALREAVDQTYNCLTVDGDTSTNDMVVLLANGASGAPRIERVSSEGYRRLVAALTESFEEMVLSIASDGEGASRVAIIRVRGARTVAEARTLARAVGRSSLFKTAIHGADPNWGRITMALGNAGVDIDPSRVGISMAETPLLRRGQPVKHDSAKTSQAMRRDQVPVVISLGLGRAEATCWSSSLTEEYVRFNSAYTT